MTLSALFKYKNTESIFMLADGLLSSDQPDHGNFIMPGAGGVGRPRSDHGMYLNSLEQNLNVLGRDLAFAYAGDHALGARFGELLERMLPFWEDSYIEALSKELFNGDFIMGEGEGQREEGGQKGGLGGSNP